MDVSGFTQARVEGVVGLAADFVVFDPDTVGDNTTRSDPQRSPSGIETVVLNGVPVVRKGSFDISQRAGRVLR